MDSLKMVGRLLLNTGRWILVAVVIWQTLVYVQTRIFSFPEPKPFCGPVLHNPYRGMDSLNWYKANFHGHAHAWGGVTNGVQSGDSVIRTYLSMGYDIPVVSNYHQIDPAMVSHAPVFIPTYEHGYNVMKSHRLSIGSIWVDFLDFPLGHLASHRQQTIDRLKEHAPVVAIAHPRFNNSHPTDHVALLTGYDCLEVLNHYRISEDHWDSVLSAGRPVWIIANDDTHDVLDPSETGVCWTMVGAAMVSSEPIYQALRSGMTYGVKGKGGHLPTTLKSFHVQDQTVTLTMMDPVEKIEWIGQGGVIRQTDTRTSWSTFTFSDTDTYIRAKAISGETSFYFNPVLRTQQGQVVANLPSATENLPMSIAFRLVVLLTGGGLIFLLTGWKVARQQRPERRLTPSPTTVRV